MNKKILILFFIIAGFIISCAHNREISNVDDSNGNGLDKLPQISYEGDETQIEGEENTVLETKDDQNVTQEMVTEPSTEQISLVTLPSASELNNIEKKENIEEVKVENKPITKDQTKVAPVKRVKKKVEVKNILATIPRKTILKGNILLNRYYIMRKGDTAETLSLLFYGVTDKASDIKKWNQNVQWKSGEILLYASPLLPSDTNMLSFYEERNVSTHEYSVSSGDTLLTIAQKWHNSSDRWKEIGITNGVLPSDSLSPGKILILYPKDLSVYSFDATNHSEYKSKNDNALSSLEEKISELEKNTTKEMDENRPQLAEPKIGSFRFWKYVAIVALVFFIILFFYNRRKKNLSGEDNLDS